MGEKSQSEVFGPKGPKIDPRRGFSSFMKNWQIKLIFFCLKLQKVYVLKLPYNIWLKIQLNDFDKFLVLGFFRQNGPQSRPKMKFFKFYSKLEAWSWTQSKRVWMFFFYFEKCANLEKWAYLRVSSSN